MPAPRIADYDAIWPLVAEDWSERILGATAGLPGADGFRVDHIGSTAVPGLAAKPIVDLQLRVGDLPSEDAMSEALEPLGFVLAPGARADSPGVTADTPRPGSDADPSKHAKLLFHRPATEHEPEIILHVRRQDSPFADFVVAFRDWLRDDARAAESYERVKRELAGRFEGAADYDDYTRAKAEFLANAQIEVGWRNERLD